LRHPERHDREEILKARVQGWCEGGHQVEYAGDEECERRGAPGLASTQEVTGVGSAGWPGVSGRPTTHHGGVRFKIVCGAGQRDETL
jgi:hypothetical protein